LTVNGRRSPAPVGVPTTRLERRRPLPYSFAGGPLPHFRASAGGRWLVPVAGYGKRYPVAAAPSGGMTRWPPGMGGPSHLDLCWLTTLERLPRPAHRRPLIPSQAVVEGWSRPMP
jgi:hypothetical protein